MKPTSKKNSTLKSKKQAPQMQLSQQISLYNQRSSAYANITYSVFIYAYGTNDTYTFTNNSDNRTLAFSQIMSSSEYTNFGTVYSNYRIKSASIIVNPVVSKTAVYNYPLLQLNCDPEIVSLTNPTNSTFVLRDTNHLFSPLAIVPKPVTFTFPGVGTSTNIWKSVSDAPSGGFTIGNNTPGGLFSNQNSIVFEALFTLLVEFNNAK